MLSKKFIYLLTFIIFTNILYNIYNECSVICKIFKKSPFSYFFIKNKKEKLIITTNTYPNNEYIL